jgi:hypothetical protein
MEDITPVKEASSYRQKVCQHYRDLCRDQSADADKVFIDGHTLKELDSSTASIP